MFPGRYIRERTKSRKIELLIYDKRLYAIVKSIKEKPTEFFNKLESEEKKALISGFTDADGYVGVKEIAIYDSNRELLNKICEFLQTLKIKCRVTRNKGIWRLRIREARSIKLFIKFISPLKSSPTSPGSNPVGETVGASAGDQSTTAWFCRGKLGVTDLQG